MDKAKEFEKGWEQYQAEKKKQIEEMAKELLNACAWRFGKPNDYKEIFNDIAEDLIKLNYQKITEDRVVLTKRELLDNCELNYDKGYKKGSKETAEKIYRELQGHGTTYVKKWIEKEFGIKIKE